MSTVKVNAAQIGQSVTATNNFTWYQPASPDGTVRLGNGNSGAVTNLLTIDGTGNLTFANSVSLTAASTKSITLNGGGGTNGLVLDANNNVGIGTASSGGKLEISGTGAGIVLKQNATGAATYYVFDNTIETGGKRWRFGYSGAAGASLFSLYNFTDSVLAWATDASGNLGLGVTPTTGWSGFAKAFTLRSTGSSIDGSIANSGATNAISLISNAYYNAGWKYVYTGGSYPAGRYDIEGNQHSWYIAPSGTAGNSITFTQAMTLDASGRLLVGYTGNSLGGLLQVNDKVQFTKSTTINSSSLTTVTTTNAGFIMAGDASYGGTCICVTDNTSGLSIIGQIGTTVFVTTSPTANQIQILNSAGNIQCLAGSSRNGVTIIVTNIQLR